MIELLIVIAVIAIVAGTLFPVFSTAKAEAVNSACLSNFHQVSSATQLYLGDYNDAFMPVNHEPGQQPNAGTDRTWVQMLLPYVGNFRVFKCPADTANLAESAGTFDEDLQPGDLFARYYTASMHVNVGYNFQYLAPVLKVDGQWMSEPKDAASLPDPSRMLLFVDSVWQVKNGKPVGGGSFLVAPPCRWERLSGASIDTIGSGPVSASDSGAGVQQIYSPSVGWQPFADGGAIYGGAWPWHAASRATTASVDGSVRSLSMGQLEAGCEVLPAWKGKILDRHSYLWSPE